METNHTKGPWELGASKQSVVKADGQNSKVIAAIRTNDYLVNPRFEEGEAEANARLIAAAPDLLEALKDFTYRFPKDYKEGIKLTEHTCFNGYSWQIIDKAITAIQKATQP
jgi:hypothetical protein